MINILSGMSRGCLTITILPSDLVEGDEDIHLAINEETTMATVEEGNTTVIIASDGGNMYLSCITLHLHNVGTGTQVLERLIKICHYTALLETCSDTEFHAIALYNIL